MLLVQQFHDLSGALVVIRHGYALAQVISSLPGPAHCPISPALTFPTNRLL